MLQLRNSSQPQNSPQSNKKIPHTYLILFAFVLLSCLLTYLIPAGTFERVVDEATGQTLVVPGSYHAIERTPVAPYLIFHKFITAISETKTAALIFFIMLIGGAFEVIMETGCLNAFCENVLKHMKRRELWIIPIFIFLFSVFGFTMGLTTASVVFVPIGIAIAKELGIPKMCGMAMIALGTNAGFTAGVFNPFGVGIAQMIAEVPLFSGAALRWIVLFVLNTVTSLYLVFYASKHREPVDRETTKCISMTIRQKCVLAEFVTAFLVLSLGIALLEWKTSDILVIFILTGIIMGLTNRFSLSKICGIFTEGCKKMTKGMLIIGIAATIRLVLSDGNIMDTITQNLTQAVVTLPKEVQLMGMYFVATVTNLFVTSGSAKAALLMPLFTPMADTLGISRQSAVFAFQLGDGLTNLSSPVSTTLNGVLAVSEESYEKWMKFYLPLIGINILLGMGFVIIASVIGY